MVRSVHILGRIKHILHVFHLINKVIYRHPTKKLKHPTADSKYQGLHF